MKGFVDSQAQFVSDALLEAQPMQLITQERRDVVCALYYQKASRSTSISQQKYFYTIRSKKENLELGPYSSTQCSGTLVRNS